jgi:AcrR family transcriptional regulator
MKNNSSSAVALPVVRPGRRERTRERICIAARELFLTAGFGATTIEQIALAAGTRRSTLYNHFRDKNDILSAIGETYLDAVAGVIDRLPAPRPSRAQIDAWMREFAEFALRERAPTLLVVHFNAAIWRQADAAFRQAITGIRKRHKTQGKAGVRQGRGCTARTELGALLLRGA